MSRLAFTLLATCALTGVAQAADPAPVSISMRITVIADLDGDIHDARLGRGGADATRMAVTDFGGIVLAMVPAALVLPAAMQCRMAL